MRTSRPFAQATSRPAIVTVIQPYVPAYRVPLFDELARQLAAAGCRLEVLHGKPDSVQAQRLDATTGAWSSPVRVRQWRWRGHDVRLRAVLRRTRNSRVIIAELASTNLDTYVLALLRPRRLMLWGHGRAYVTEASALDARLELWLARRAQRVFVYTEGGAAYLRSKGYPADRLSVVRNTTDTVALRRAASSVSDADVAQFRRDLDLGSGPVASFVGSYDESKGLPLLFAAAEFVHDRLPDFRLIVAGAGPLQSTVDDAARQFSFVRSLPRADVGALAVIGRSSDCLVIPGRIGLVAVDALALGLPVVTTSFPHHAPEYEYLAGTVAVVSKQNAADLAAHIVQFLTDRERVAASAAAARILGEQFTIVEMAAAFRDPILAAVSGLREPSAS